MTNSTQLMARFDRDYQLKLKQIEQSAYNEQYRANANMELERYKADEKRQQMQFIASNEDKKLRQMEELAYQKMEQENQREVTRGQASVLVETVRGKTALSVENRRGENSLVLANQDHQNKLSQMQYLSEREDQRENIRGRNALAIADKENENQLEQMQADLQNRMTLASFDFGFSVMSKVIDEDSKRRASMLVQMEQRSQLRGEVLKMGIGALIQEKLAQKQHAREVEKMKLASSLNQAEQYFQSVCSYLSHLLDASREEEAKAEIDRLFSEWGAGNV